MKVASLIAKLSELDLDAEVLLLAGCSDISQAEELRQVEFRADWRCEVHFRDDGLSQSLHGPSHLGATMDYDASYDRTVDEKVVLLAAHAANLDYMFIGDSAIKGRTLGKEWLKNAISLGRRAMVEDGRLISRDLLLRLLDIQPAELDALAEQGRIFGVSVGGLPYFPSIFANPRVNAERLQSLSRLLEPAPATSRLDFLLSAWGHLGDRRPIEMLDDDRDYKRLRRSAAVFAEEWSRTTVRIFEGHREEVPIGDQPLYTAMAEFDPRRPLWSRAGATLTEFGFEHPPPPYPQCELFTVFVQKETRGTSGSSLEGAVCIQRDNGGWRFFAAWPSAAIDEADNLLVCQQHDVVSVCKVVLDRLQRATGA